MMPNFAAHFNLEDDETQIVSLLQSAERRARHYPDFHLAIAAHRNEAATLNVWHEIETRGLQRWISYYPYIDIQRDFPIKKAECTGWFDAQTPDAVTASFAWQDDWKHRPRKTVLFVTFMHPGKAEGNSRLMRDWLRRFREAGYNVHVLYYAGDGPSVVTEVMRESETTFCDYFHEVIPSSPLVNRNLDGYNLHVDDWCGSELFDKVKQLTRLISFDMVFVNYSFLSAVFDAVPAFSRKVLLTHDCFKDRNKRLLEQGLPESGWMSLTSAGEQLACQRSDVVIALQAEDAEYFKALCGGEKKISVISPTFPLVEVTPPELIPDRKLRLGFFGSHNWINEVSLNRYLVRWCEDPFLVERTEITLAGGICTNLDMFVAPAVQAQANPRLLGRIEHLSELFSQCDLVLNPEQGGTGIKIKTLETMAHGAPLLSTRAGSVGIESKSRFHNAVDIEELISLTREVAADFAFLEDVRQETIVAYGDYMAKHATTAADLIGDTAQAVRCISALTPWPPEPSSKQITTTDYIKTHGADYHPELFQKVANRIELTGKRVLEIGSDFHLVSARLFAANGAQEVVATNIGDWKSDEPLPDNVKFLVGDVGDMDLTPGSFDVIYGIAILEHIPEFDKVVETCKRVLAPDGVIYLQGCPVWGGSVGHHVWFEPEAEGEDMRVRFAAGGSATCTNPAYRFSDDAHNPIPHWAHLALEPDALTEYLIQGGLPEKHAVGIVDYVYNRPGHFVGSCSNFSMASEIIGAFRPSFDVAVNAWQFGTEPNDFYHMGLEKISHFDLDTLGLDLWMRHPEVREKEAKDVPKISVIIPFCDVEEHISECLDSVRTQDYPSLEVILIDDKGTDASVVHAQRFCVEDDRFRLLAHDVNKGLGLSRNTGVAEATGDFLFFLDSDDVLAAPTVLRDLVNAAITSGSQVVTGRAVKLLADERVEEFDRSFEELTCAGADITYAGQDAFYACYCLKRSGKYLPMRAWGYLIDTECYKSLDTGFPAGSHEDLGFMPVLYNQANSVHYIGTDVVKYRYRANSISNTPWTTQKSHEFKGVWAHLRDMLETHSLSHELGAAALLTAQQAIWKIHGNTFTLKDMKNIFSKLGEILADADPVYRPSLVSDTIEAAHGMFDSVNAPAHLRYLVIGAIPDAAFISHHANVLGVDLLAPIASGAGECHGDANQERAEAILTTYRAAEVGDLRDFPSMLTEADKAVYYDAALNFKGHGLIVDGGCFVGGTTQHLVQGLRDNPRFDADDPALEKVIKVYDLFQIDEDYILEHLQNNFPDKHFEVGGSFEPIFSELNARHDRYLEVFSGDVIAAGYPFERDIEVLGVDLCKALPVTDFVLRTFYPRVIEGGLVIQQDFIHEFHPHIHLSMLRLDDHFTLDAEMLWGGSVTYRVKRRITDEAIVERFGADSSWYQDRDRNVALLEDVIARMHYPENRWIMILTLGFYYWSLGDQDTAREMYYRAKVDSPHLEASDITRKHLRD